jgi:outer membrane protein assembly factor BamB
VKPWILAALLAAAALAGGAGAAEQPGWSTYGGDPSRTGAIAEQVVPASVKPAFVLPVTGRITSQVLAARDVPGPGLTTLYATTSAGRIYAVSEDGYVRWRDDLGELPNKCPQLDGYGVGGTPVIDPATKTLYAVDAVGQLHALDLATGAERPGWPVTLYTDPAQELVWGAVALADGSVYAATGSYCDSPPFQGRVVRVDLATKAVSTWLAVPVEQGGGGGIWGWGGIAFSAALDRLFVVTGNAFAGGTNVGPAFSEAAGYGEALVSLTPDLDVVGSGHPAAVNQPLDLDFVGSPVLFDRPGCGQLAVAQDKIASLFGWRADKVGAGTLWRAQLEPFDPDNPVLSQPAYDPRLFAVYSVTDTRAVRIDVAANCSEKVGWSQPLGTSSLNGSPTVAGNAVWFAVSGTPALVALDADTGTRLAAVPLPGLAITAPTVIDGRIFIGTFTGQLVGFTSPTAKPLLPAPGTGTVAGHVSRLDATHRWESRETGVYSTDDGGRHWRRIFATPASAVVRTSVKVGMIRVAAVAPGCTCARTFWTKDGGLHWTQTRAVAGGLTGRGSSLYWLSLGNTQLRQIAPWPPVGPIHSRTVLTTTGGRIVSVALVAGGVAALIRDPTTGSSSVAIVGPTGTQTVQLPDPPGPILSERLTSSAAGLTVQATVFTDGALETVGWSSASSQSWQPAVRSPMSSH